jgi:uncharacterized RDD family membrane protein YckC
MDMPTKAGWYDDPENDQQLRYFDGVVWSKHTTPRSTRAASAAPQPGQQAYPGQGHAPQYPGQVQAQPPQQAPGYAAPPAGPPAAAPGAPQASPPGAPQQGWQQPGQQYPGQNQQFPGAPQGGWNAPSYPGMQPVAATPDGQPLAGYWQRVGAYIIDGIIQFVILLILGGWLAYKGIEPVWDEITRAIDSGDTSALETFSANNVNYGYLLAFGLVAAAIQFAYAVFFLSRSGATPGKSAMGISVRLRERPGPLTVAVAAQRTSLQAALSLLSNIPLLGNLFSLGALLDLLWPAWDDKKQALHDKFAKTNVVVGKQPRS